jgi:hypothetical protein
MPQSRAICRHSAPGPPRIAFPRVCSRHIPVMFLLSRLQVLHNCLSHATCSLGGWLGISCDSVGRPAGCSGGEAAQACHTRACVVDSRACWESSLREQRARVRLVCLRHGPTRADVEIALATSILAAFTISRAFTGTGDCTGSGSGSGAHCVINVP